MTQDVDFLIIGAGAAGIGAARQLRSLGASPLVLEAANHIGGRAETFHYGTLALDLGCGWLHSGERNAWTKIAAETGFAVDRRTPAWGRQYRSLGFPPSEQAAASAAMERWAERLVEAPPASDRASDALEPGNPWNDFIAARTGYISGVGPERISVADYVAYDEASSDENWRVEAGYGTLVAASLPPAADLRLGVSVRRIDLGADRAMVETDAGTLRARCVISTVSTNVLAGDAIAMPAALDPWRDAAARLPLGRNEKVFLEIVGDAPFEDETHVVGAPHSRRTGSYYIRPLGAPVIEAFLGGDSAEVLDGGPEAGFDFAVGELRGLFGSDIARWLRPLTSTHWSGLATIGGGYSCALPGHADARARLARPFEDRLFFAGEATSRTDFSTAHGAHDSGVRAADEAFAAIKGLQRLTGA
ncbi:flavin monoamine oxidase family protein [Aureimonas phyllosphaerae]|uniref:Tryptophan 2-monooxygenase n=1 Tax=Aureimonas phyllosphaerae TaxID=1166078 RepID=A0A7W6BPS4_9HYPH|nr:FAD-dependent oxidoreductase [Aureimonas phyllosphaerae]MBB3934672.1 monoamine oxidase [Aureimonas phyllosphaerae]MBB3958112.1 monoamine oxidase [Aureimonas phyllosphaerae]SFE91998.1 monoamine oxidase [Aureimonas phyllosphaerae]